MRNKSNGTTRFLLKRHMYIGVIVFLTVFFLMPFWSLSCIPGEKADILNYTNSAYIDQDLTRLATHSMFNRSLSLEAMTAAIGGLGFLTAVVLMSHLFSRKQCMLQFSLPERRGTDWLRRCVCYLVLCVGAILLNILVYLMIVAVNGLLPWMDWGWFLSKCGMLLLINLYGFAIGMLSCVLTGTCWAALLAGAVLIIGAEGLCIIWHDLCGSYLHTYTDDLKTLVRNLSPAFTLYKGYYQPDEFIWLPGALAIPAALAVSLLLYRIRKAESAERTLAFSPLHIILSLVLPLIGGSLMGVIVQLSFMTEWSLYAGFLLGAAITFWVCRILFNQRICGFGREWFLPVAAALLLCIGGVMLYTDALGYDRYLPRQDKVTGITYSAVHTDSDKQIALTQADTLDAAYEWCALMRDEADTLPNAFECSGYADTQSSVLVTYHMGSRSVTRRYPNDSARTAAQPQLKAILESSDYCEGIMAYNLPADRKIAGLHLSIYDSVVDYFMLQEKFGVYPELNGLSRNTSAADIDRYIDAFREDLRQRTLEDRQQDAIFTLGVHFEGAGRYLLVYPSDQHLLRAIFGDKTDDIVAYLTGGYAAEENLLVLKATYSMSRQALQDTFVDSRELIDTVQVAASPEEAAAWVREGYSSTLNGRYYMPSLEDERFSRLMIYNLTEVAEWAPMAGYEIPEEYSEFPANHMLPVYFILDLNE